MHLNQKDANPEATSLMRLKRVFPQAHRVTHTYSDGPSRGNR